MANVSFKRGLHANLPWHNAVDGTFYLTTDTNRFYAAYGSNLVDLNQYIKMVAKESDLNNLANKQVGDFVYITDGNILAVYNGAQWQQINPDTNTDNDTKVTDLSITKTVQAHTNEKKGSIKLTLTLTQYTYDINGAAGPVQTITKDIVLIDEDEFRTVVPVEVDVQASAPANNSTTISTTGLGSDGDGFTITGDETVKITGSANQIVIGVDPAPFTQDLNASATEGTVNLNLTDGNGKVDSVQFAAGLNLNVSLTGSAEDNNEVITFAHDTIDTSASTGTQEPKHEGTFTAVESISISNGHVTGVKTTTYTLPEDVDTTYHFDETEGNAVSADNEGRISVILTDSNGKTSIGKSGKDLYYTIGSGTYYNTADLPVYTKTEVDARFKSLSGVTYINTIQGGSTEVGATALSVAPAAGDMYKVSQSGYFTAGENNKIQAADGSIISTLNADVGDVFIATGTEGDDGIIPLGQVIWTYIPSGDDTDSQYAFVTSPDADQVFLRNTTTGADVGSLMIKEGTAINVVTTASDADKRNAVIEISHEDVTSTNNSSDPATADLEHEGTFTVVDGVTVNAQGHVTNVNYKTYTMPEDHDTTYDVSVDYHSAQKLDLLLTDSNGQISGITISGDPVIVLSEILKTGSNSYEGVIINHAMVKTEQSVMNSDSPSQLAYGDTFIAPYNFSTDGRGHITQIVNRSYKLPESDDTTYTLSGALTTAETADTDGYVNSFTMTDTLTDKNGKTANSIFNVSSTSLKCKVAESNTVSIDMVWGSF